MKKNLVILIGVLCFFAQGAFAQENKSKIVLGPRIEFALISLPGEEIKKDFNLHLENGYKLENWYLSVGYTPADNVIYSFNEYWIPKLPIAPVVIIGTNFTGSSFYAAGLDFEFGKGKMYGKILLNSGFNSFDPKIVFSVVIPANLVLWKSKH